jgi:UDP:flavonoid glycosyltransferase YjiC (YdhE family)
VRYLFCSLDSPGFLSPMIGIALALRERGHEVAFATGTGASTVLAAEGLERLPRGASDGPSFQVQHWFQPLSVAIQIKHVEHALGLFPADVLVGQPLTLGATIERMRSRRPLAVVGLATYLWPMSDELARQPALTDREARLLWRHQDMLDWLNKALATVRLPPYRGGVAGSPLRGDLFLLRSVPELQPAADRLPPQVCCVGGCLWEPASSDPALEGWLAAARAAAAPVLYVQPGRSFASPAFWPDLVAAFAGSGWRVAASVGRLDREVGPLPPEFLVRTYLPQGRVLPGSRAALSSATSTAVLGALAAGLPSVLIPSGGEQLDVAEACQEAGVAVVLKPGEVTPAVVRQAVDAVTGDPAYGANARRLQAALARYDSFRLAAERLEELAATTRVE